MPTFKGIWPALVTPFTESHRVNVPVLRDLVEYLIDKRVDGLFVGGTTGEGIFLPVADRKLMVETAVNQARGRIQIISHVGAVSAHDAIDLALHAKDSGAAGVSSIIPPLYPNWTSLYHYFEALANAVGDFPLLVYLLNPNYDAVGLMKELVQIPTLVGGKYTGPNMYEMRRIIDMGKGDWSIWSGMDEQCVYAAMMGAHGAIGSTINFMPGVYRRIRESVAQGDYAAAQDLQVRANKITELMISVGFQPALKAVMTSLGIPCGGAYLPFLPISDEQRKTLFDGLAKTDFNEFVKL